MRFQRGTNGRPNMCLDALEVFHRFMTSAASCADAAPLITKLAP
jgi:hypothetical protein